MYLKRSRYILFLIVFVFSFVTACSSATPGINEINCQVSDVDANPPFLLLKEETAVPASGPFPEQMTAYHRVALAEYQLTYTDALCTIRTYPAADLAAAAWKLLCLQGEGAETAEQIGDAACGFQTEGVKEVHFQQGTAVVTVREDAGGSHVATWAAAVNGRLTQ